MASKLMQLTLLSANWQSTSRNSERKKKYLPTSPTERVYK